MLMLKFFLCLTLLMTTPLLVHAVDICSTDCEEMFEHLRDIDIASPEWAAQKAEFESYLTCGSMAFWGNKIGFRQSNPDECREMDRLVKSKVFDRFYNEMPKRFKAIDTALDELVTDLRKRVEAAVRAHVSRDSRLTIKYMTSEFNRTTTISVPDLDPNYAFKEKTVWLFKDAGGADDGYSLRGKTLGEFGVSVAYDVTVTVVYTSTANRQERTTTLNGSFYMDGRKSVMVHRPLVPGQKNALGGLEPGAEPERVKLFIPDSNRAPLTGRCETLNTYVFNDHLCLKIDGEGRDIVKARIYKYGSAHSDSGQPDFLFNEDTTLSIDNEVFY